MSFEYLCESTWAWDKQRLSALKPTGLANTSAQTLIYSSILEESDLITLKPAAGRKLYIRLLNIIEVF